jgi:hypothetical protein
LRAEPGRSALDTLADEAAQRRMLLSWKRATRPGGRGGRGAAAARSGARDWQVLATAGEPLGVHGETGLAVPPLAPADAFTLLSERTAAARGGRPAPAEEVADLAHVASRWRVCRWRRAGRGPAAHGVGQSAAGPSR